jgi:transposase
MLGPPKRRQLERSVLVSLEALVPPGHCSRHLEATLDLSFVCELVGDCYAPVGRPSIDPVVFFKLQLILFFEGLRSERKLLETASLHLAHRWYLGYPLDEPLPDHSTLSRTRARLGRPVFQRFFERVVELCQEAGLVWGKELFFDATKVRANADVDSLVPRLGRVIDDHVEALFAGQTEVAEDARRQEPPAPAGAGPAAPGMANVLPFAREDGPGPPEPAGSPEAAPPRWDVLERCRLDPTRASSEGYRRSSDQVVSRTVLLPLCGQGPRARRLLEGRATQGGRRPCPMAWLSRGHAVARRRFGTTVSVRCEKPPRRVRISACPPRGCLPIPRA